MMLGCHEKSCERQRFHTTVTSVLRSAAVLASLNTRSLLRLNHTQDSSFSNSTPASARVRLSTYCTSRVLPRAPVSMRRTAVPMNVPVSLAVLAHSHQPTPATLHPSAHIAQNPPPF